MDSEGLSIVGKYSLDDPHRPSMDIHILVVDDDATTLSLISAMLRTLRYKVMGVKNPLDALATLRTQNGLIDLVLTDLHMPYINGFQLQEQIEKEFQLPVVMMSADDKESVLLRSARSGIALFILKPLTPNDLKYMWQYAIKYKKGNKSINVVEEIESNSNRDMVMSEEQISGNDMREPTSASPIEVVGKEMVPFDTNIIIRNDSSAGSNVEENSTDVSGNLSGLDKDHNRNIQSGPRKPKIVWTNSLQNRFLLAIKHIGLEKTVPKKILDYMNVPGLTREHVASHLQKYRLFLKKVAEKAQLNAKEIELETDKLYKSSFAAGIPESLPLNLSEIIGRSRAPIEPWQPLATSLPLNFTFPPQSPNVGFSSFISSSTTPPIATLRYSTNNDVNYSNLFRQSGGAMTRTSTNDAPYINYINEAANRINNVSSNRTHSTQPNDTSGLISGLGGINHMLSTQMNSERQQPIELFNGGYRLMENTGAAQVPNNGEFEGIINPNPLHYISSNNVNYQGYNNVGADSRIVDLVTDNNDLVTFNNEPGQVPIPNIIYNIIDSDEDGDDVLDPILNSLSPLTEVVNNPPPANPIADVDSSCPILVQENEVPAINSQSSSQVGPHIEHDVSSNPTRVNTSQDYFPIVDYEFQQQGNTEVVEPTDEFLNMPTQMLNEMDWNDEFISKILNDDYLGPFE